MRILFAEDEIEMQKIVCLYLKKAGYQVETVSDGLQALERLATQSYDLLLADWMMPGMTGLTLCKEVKALSIPVKIIMLTAKGETQDEITGLSLGVDDYIKKPVEPKILLLRIEKVLGLYLPLTCGNLLLDVKGHRVLLSSQEIKLTQKEWDLLYLFMNNQGIVLSRELLLDRVWGNDYDRDERTLDTHIRRLRQKIGKTYITTYVGMGYRMDPAHE